MKQRPILFNGAMVRAILNGQKTQTRRIVKPHGWTTEQMSKYEFAHVLQAADAEGLTCKQPAKDAYAGFNLTPGAASPTYFKCPFGTIGDQLWVRETWMPDAPRDGTWADVEFYGCKDAPLSLIPEHYRKPEHCLFNASWTGAAFVGWTPSIHMPRWASRITLEITSIRVERLQDISEEDAEAEGIDYLRSIPDVDETLSAKELFSALWDSVYHSWGENPWVWVIEFKRVEQ